MATLGQIINSEVLNYCEGIEFKQYRYARVKPPALFIWKCSEVNEHLTGRTP